MPSPLPPPPGKLDRRAIARAILESQPGATALNLSQSLQFARQLQQRQRISAR